MNLGRSTAKEKKGSLLGIKVSNTLKMHNLSVNCMCLIDKERFASCSNDKTIRVYDIATLECVKRMTGHEYSVNYISLLSNGKLVSGSFDNTIKIWDISTGECSFTLTKHTNSVFQVSEISNNRICSCSDDCTLMIFDNSPPYSHKQTLSSKTGPIRSFIELPRKNRIISSSQWGDEIQIWNSVTYQCETLLSNFRCATPLLRLDENSIIIGGCESKIMVFDTASAQIKKIIQFHQSNGVVKCMVRFTDQIILLATLSGDLVEINIKTNEFYINHKAHKMTANWLLMLDDKTCASSSSDRSIKIWKREV